MGGEYKTSCPFMGAEFCEKDCLHGAIPFAMGEKAAQRIVNYALAYGDNPNVVCLLPREAEVLWDGVDPRSYQANKYYGHRTSAGSRGPKRKRK